MVQLYGPVSWETVELFWPTPIDTHERDDLGLLVDDGVDSNGSLVRLVATHGLDTDPCRMMWGVLTLTHE